MTKRREFVTQDYLDTARILDAAATLMDGRSSHAKLYRRLARMLREAAGPVFDAALYDHRTRLAGGRR